MNAEVFGLFGLIILVLVILAEATKGKKTLGVLASLLLIMLGLWVFTDGVQVRTGEVTTVNLNESHDLSDEHWDNVTISGNQTALTTYEDITLPYVDFNDFMALFLICLGIFGTIYYVLSR